MLFRFGKIQIKLYLFFNLGGAIIKTLKRNICFLLATIILIISVSTAYENSYSKVKANDTEDVLNMIEFVLGVCLTVAGGTATGGVLTVVEGIGIAMSGYEFGKSLTDNGDGTVTIDGELIQAVIDEFEQYKEVDGFDDSYHYRLDDGNNYKQKFYQKNSLHSNRIELAIHERERKGNAIVGYIDTTNITSICVRLLAYDTNKSIKFAYYTSGTYEQYYSSGKYDCGTSSGIPSCGEDDTFNAYGNFPIFRSKATATAYFTDKTVASSAINYHKNKPTYRHSTAYNKNYSGGNITINKNKLTNVINKIDDLNNKYPDDSDTDKIINEFNTWLYSDDDEPETETPIEPDTSEVGDDLTEANGWLQKIYNRIGDFMNSFNQQKQKLNNLLESKFNELITAVKNIGKSDQPETEPETETETETNSDKLDTIIDNQEKSQGILQSILTAIKDGFTDIKNKLNKNNPVDMPDIEIDGQGIGDNWFDFLKKFFKDIGSGVTLLVGGFSDTVTELTKVFPFSIPITLTLIMQMFSAPPQAPKYELPIKLEKLGIDEVIIIDLSDFGVLSIISRTFLTVIYCMALYKLTLKIITAKKGG